MGGEHGDGRPKEEGSGVPAPRTAGRGGGSRARVWGGMERIGGEEETRSFA